MKPIKTKECFRSEEANANKDQRKLCNGSTIVDRIAHKTSEVCSWQMLVLKSQHRAQNTSTHQGQSASIEHIQQPTNQRNGYTNGRPPFSRKMLPRDRWSINENLIRYTPLSSQESAAITRFPNLPCSVVVQQDKIWPPANENRHIVPHLLTPHFFPRESKLKINADEMICSPFSQALNVEAYIESNNHSNRQNL